IERAARTRASTGASRSRCFGEPNRADAPAARMTAAIILAILPGLLAAGGRAAERGPRGLAHEERPRGRIGRSGRRIRQPRVARRDEDAAPRVERVREEVAEPAVLAGRDARRPALADRPVVHVA